MRDIICTGDLKLLLFKLPHYRNLYVRELTECSASARCYFVVSAKWLLGSRDPDFEVILMDGKVVVLDVEVKNQEVRGGIL
jgi:hypothetical protein